MRTLVDHNIAVLAQVDAILEQLSDEELMRGHTLLFGSSVGQHIRHILEFYQCLLSAVDTGSFSYDRRRRDLQIETEVAAARASVAWSKRHLEQLGADRELRMDADLPGVPLGTGAETTLKRELLYLADHGVHHLAMVRIALEQALPHVRINGHLGVAVSTQNHRQH
ncbi:MAG: DinB family protein [Flavobacteriales bacterium]|jgi:uncharacterized damage-inducible protein DinB|nr:DinB family protein [Flavobacteriales bacterium]